MRITIMRFQTFLYFKCFIHIFLILFCFFIYQSHQYAQSPNFSGTWILNPGKSQLEDKPEGLITTVFIINQNGDIFRLTRYHIYSDKKNKISFKMHADGKTRRIKLLFKGKLEQKESTLQSTLWRKNFLNIVNYKYGMNENEFIADEVYSGYPKNHHNVWVFDREVLK